MTQSLLEIANDESPSRLIGPVTATVIVLAPMLADAEALIVKDELTVLATLTVTLDGEKMMPLLVSESKAAAPIGEASSFIETLGLGSPPRAIAAALIKSRLPPVIFATEAMLMQDVCAVVDPYLPVSQEMQSDSSS